MWFFCNKWLPEDVSSVNIYFFKIPVWFVKKYFSLWSSDLYYDITLYFMCKQL